MKYIEAGLCFHLKTSYRKPKVEAQPLMRALEEPRTLSTRFWEKDYQRVDEYE
jgi:hypothetical protein